MTRGDFFEHGGERWKVLCSFNDRIDAFSMTDGRTMRFHRFGDEVTLYSEADARPVNPITNRIKIEPHHFARRSNIGTDHNTLVPPRKAQP